MQVILPSVGWAATAVFTASYFARSAATLRYLQMAGAALWLVYGVVIGAPPVIVANTLLLAAAAWTAVRGTGAMKAQASEAPVR